MYYKNNKTGRGIDITFDLMKIEYADGVISCIKDAYGENYLDQRVYEKCFLFNQCEQNKMILAVAKNSQNDDVCGICTIKFSDVFKKTGEIAMHIIKSEYRGFLFGVPLVQYTMKKTQPFMLNVLYAHTVTFHTVAQHEAQRCGMTGCGALFSELDNRVFLHGYDNKRCEKMTAFISALPQNKKDAGVIYVPQPHIDFAHKIYQKLGITYQLKCAQSDDVDLPEAGQTIVMNDEMQSNCYIIIKQLGSDTIQKTDDTLARYQRQSRQTYHAFLDMRDQNILHIYDELIQRGFFFAGFQPLGDNAEYLIMHYDQNIVTYFDDIQTTQEFAELLNEIKKYAQSREDAPCFKN